MNSAWCKAYCPLFGVCPLLRNYCCIHINVEYDETLEPITYVSCKYRLYGLHEYIARLREYIQSLVGEFTVFSSASSSLSFSTRTTARVIGAVLEDGVGAPATHYCDVHQLCGGWEGESRDVCPLDTASCVLQLTHCCTDEVCPVLA